MFSSEDLCVMKQSVNNFVFLALSIKTLLLALLFHSKLIDYI